MTQGTFGMREALGSVVGAMGAGPVALSSALRRARTFHPRGVLATGHLEPFSSVAAMATSERFVGHALVRLSGALSKGDAQTHEVLGIGLRISDHMIRSADPAAGDQDLTFATIVSPLMLPIAGVTTRSDDFLANKFWGVAPFRIEGVGRVKLRLSPMVVADMQREARRERLERAIAERRACFLVEMRHTMQLPWEPLATLVLDGLSRIDQEALRFDPFRAGRGIEPVGFVHAVRKYVYRASQWARPAYTRPMADGTYLHRCSRRSRSSARTTVVHSRS